MWTIELILLLACGLNQLSQSSAQNFNAATTSDVQHAVRLQPHHHHVLNRHSGPLLQILNYTFTTPEIQLRKGLTHLGSNWRLRRALRHVVHHAGATLNIGAIGGSVTCGHGASKEEVTGWFNLLKTYMVHADWPMQKHAFPAAHLVFRNSAMPGVDSSFTILCMDARVDPDVDILLSEFLLNDEMRDTITHNTETMRQERLLRKALQLRHQPALIFVNVFRQSQGTEEDVHDHVNFYNTQEDVNTAISQYYDVATVSLRTASYRLAMHNHDPKFSFKAIMSPDHRHPADLGHTMIAELVIWLLQQTAIDLIERPYNQQDVDVHAEPVPAPMYSGNDVPDAATCLLQDAFVPSIIRKDGFEYIAEGTDASKRGYVSLTVGSQLHFKVSTWRDGIAESLVRVYLSYLTSYEHMGVGIIRCESGCACNPPPPPLNMNTTAHASQSALFSFDVTQAKECVISITVAPETSSGEHKVKINGMLVSEHAAPTGTDHVWPTDLGNGVNDISNFRAP